MTQMLEVEFIGGPDDGDKSVVNPREDSFALHSR